MTHLGTLNTSYGQKKGRMSNQQCDSRPLKVGNHLNFLTCPIPLKSSQQGLQLCFKPHLNWRFASKVMGPQSRRNPNLGNFETPTWESQDKKTFECQSHGQAQSVLEGGRWWLPPSLGCGESCEFMFACGLAVHQKCSDSALTNLLFGLCRSM